MAFELRNLAENRKYFLEMLYFWVLWNHRERRRVSGYQHFSVQMNLMQAIWGSCSVEVSTSSGNCQVMLREKRLPLPSDKGFSVPDFCEQLSYGNIFLFLLLLRNPLNTLALEPGF
jgi:hypothetical protein